MAYRVTIQPTGDWFGQYPTYYVKDDGVTVGPAGELILLSAETDGDGKPVKFRIYGPGMWKEINAEQLED